MSEDPRAILQQADKAASSASSSFSFFGSKTEKYENAAELYSRAANAFRLQNLGKEAGKAYERAATVQQNNLNEPDEAANTLAEAFKSYRKTDPEDAARVLAQAIHHFTMKGNFRRAAKHQQDLAELFELEIGDKKRAFQAYETAAGWYESDNAAALANKLHLKVADLAAEEGDYQKAIDIYEMVAKSSLNNNLMKWSVKDYFFKAGICRLALGDVAGTQNAVDSYVEMDPAFGESREAKLLTDVAEAVDNQDVDAFQDHLYQFDRINRLDKWKVNILGKVKKAMDDKAEDFS